MTQSSNPPARRHRYVRITAAAVGAAALATSFVSAAAAATAASGPAPFRSHVVKAGGGTVRLHRIGTVNLRALARADARRQQKAETAPATTHPRMTPLGLPANARAAGHPASRRNIPGTALKTAFAGNVPGEHGFDG